ncbi:hypothetical protein EVAR_84087_1 [Eumeta japonica]|uniref:Uncharacterized protein n=1 Tax=Eumeta variegata TaxID=151549 RepID=A0A4C1UYS1_EUMVA|nr:hypothetical protein EVAR_84087_1 [Eumeta japonica]
MGALRKVKKDKDWLLNIFSDSRFSLDIPTGPKTYHPLTHEDNRNPYKIVTESRAVRLFWMRAHARIAENARTDEFARRAVLTKETTAGCEK